MAVETSTTIAGLNALWPLGSDAKSEGDNHIRLIKSVLQTDPTLLSIGRSGYQAKSGGYTAVLADSGTTLVFTATGTLALTAAATLKTGWTVNVISVGVDVTVDPNAAELIDGAATIVVRRDQATTIYCDGTGFTTDRAHRRGFEHIASGSTLVGGEIQFKDLGAFSRLRASVKGQPGITNTNLVLQTSTNNGSSWDAGGSDYGSQMLNVSNAVVTGAGASGSWIYLSGGNGVHNAYPGISATVDLFDFNRAGEMYSQSQSFFWDAGGALRMFWCGGYRGNSGARNAFRMVFDGGGWANARYVLEGIRG